MFQICPCMYPARRALERLAAAAARAPETDIWGGRRRAAWTTHRAALRARPM